MRIETVTGCTAGQSNDPDALRRAGGEAHGVAELAVTYHLARERRVPAQPAAQLAHDPDVALVDVDALAHERGALAVQAAMTVGGQRADTAPQQEALELPDVAMRGGGHEGTFATAGRPPALVLREIVWEPPEPGSHRLRTLCAREDAFAGRCPQLP